MVSRIAEYEDAIQRSGEDERTVAEILLWIFRDIDARVAAGEDRATTVAELEAALRAYGTQQIDTVVNPIRTALKEAADLGAILTAGSVSPVILGAGVRTFVINEIERTKFAPAAMLVIVANDDATKVMWGRRLTYSKTTGELAVDILSSRGAGEVSSWTISAGALVGMAAQVPVAPVSGHDGQTVQEVLEQLAEATATDAAAFKEHAADRNNPHQVTADQIGTMTTEEIAESFSILSTAVNQQLAGRVRVDGDQAFSQGEQGQARSNIGADLLGGFRNKIINGGFEIWQRGVSGFAGSNAYNADRWLCQRSAAVAVSRVSHSLGQTAVPGGPRYACLIDCTAASTVDNALLMQRIEDVRTLGGMLATWTFYAHLPAGKQLVPRITQAFGGGGSATVTVDLPAIVGTGDWQRYDVVTPIPSVSGKTIGGSGNDYLQVSLVEKAPYQAFQLRTSRHSLVAGDASKEPDPFSPRHIQQELALCQRYFFLEEQWTGGHGNRYATAGSIRDAGRINFPVTMRATPTAAIRVEPTQENCSTPGTSVGTTGCTLRVTVTATGAYRAYSGEYTFDAEL